MLTRKQELEARRYLNGFRRYLLLALLLFRWSVDRLIESAACMSSSLKSLAIFDIPFWSVIRSTLNRK